MMDLTKDTFKEYITESGLVLVDFYAKWCPPCQRFMQILPRLEEAIKDICVIGKVETDTEEQLAELYEIQYIPTFIVFKNGQEVTRWDGIKTIAEIENILRGYHG